MNIANKIIVTGGAGFIGSHLCDLFLSEGTKIICIDNFNSVYDPGIKEQNITNALRNPGYSLYRADIRDAKSMEMIFSENKPDLVIHLAALPGVRPSIENPQLYLDVNINGTLILLETMRKHGVRDLLFASSSSVYGNNDKALFSESDIADNHISPYAFTKRAGELLCNTYCNLYGFNITCLRFFTVYGPRQRPDLAIHKFVNKILDDKTIDVFGDGTASRDYTFIIDAINGINRAIHSMRGFNIYNIGESRSITINQMIETIEKYLDKKALKRQLPMQTGDVIRTLADISKAKMELEYNPVYSFEEGINLFIKWKIEQRSGSWLNLRDEVYNSKMILNSGTGVNQNYQESALRI